jgi:hypothetical protein
VTVRPAPLTKAPKQAAGVLPESVGLAVIGCIDLLSTAYLLSTEGAAEGNPAMAWVLTRWGSTALYTCKALLLGGPIALLEGVRRRRPELARGALRTAVIAYAIVYGTAFIRYNLPILLSGAGPLD